MVLRVGEEYTKIVDVMNEVFGWNYKACMKGFYYVDEYKQYGAWFPKITESNNGILLPGYHVSGWVNTMTDDNEHIYMNNFEEPWRVAEKGQFDDVTKHITFAKSKGGKYVYRGVYMRLRYDSVKGCIFDKIEDDLDLSKINIIKRPIK